MFLFQKLSSGMVARYFSIFALLFLVVGCGEDQSALPEENPEAVVAKFYEYISEAKIRGGNLLIREAYKMISAKNSRIGQARFIEIVNNYPSGFRVNITTSAIKDRSAEVGIEYKMASMFGDAYTIKTVIPLIVDEENGVWQIDFTGETDFQDMATMRKMDTSSETKQTASGEE